MKIAIVGEYNKDFRPHVATNEAIEHSRKLIDITFVAEWVPTDLIEKDLKAIIKKYDGFWIAPGSPYKSLKGAIALIEHTRKNNIPTFGTCGGFQHMVIEFARNVLGIKDAEHAEYDPYASKLVVNPLTCDLKGQPLEIEIISKQSKTFSIYGTPTVKEKYYCNFGLNPDYQELINASGFKLVGSDKFKEARILELEKHPFFIATLFVPQDNSTMETPHKLVTEFIRVCQEEYERKRGEYAQQYI